MATKAPQETLTLRDSTDLLLAFEAAIEDHIDEIELNGGALPDWMATMLDEITGSREERGQAIIFKIDRLEGYASSAKATANRSARRRRVWENSVEGIKRYALGEIERHNGERIKSPNGTLRIARNGAPTTKTHFTDEQLLAFHDASHPPLRAREPQIGDGVSHLEPHPLARYLSVARVVTLDTKALGAAYEARAAELRQSFANPGAHLTDPTEIEAFIATALAAEFPGVTCVRGHHLRID